MKLSWDGTHFIALNSFDYRRELKAAGFVWSSIDKVWFSPNPQVAAHFRKHADELAKKKISRALIIVSPWVGRIRYPKGLTPLDFQPMAAQFALDRNYSYLALDPGLGKTIIMALIANSLDRGVPIVIVCPSGLALNVYRELEKWRVFKRRVHIYEPTKPLHDNIDILIVPDFFIHDPLGLYHALYDRIRAMAKGEGATLFVDEAQRFGDLKAQRTMGLLGRSGIAHEFSRVCFLSGTPIRKRPISLYPILSTFAGETIDFMSEHDYGLKWCAGFWDGYDWNYKGASNFKSLAERIRSRFMLRLRKKDVLRDLPSKTEEIIYLAKDEPRRCSQFTHKHLAKYSPELAKEKLGSIGAVAKYRRMVGVAKTPFALSFIKDILNEGDESLLIVAQHQEVLEKLQLGLKAYQPYLVYGKTPRKMKQQHVDDFQTGKSRVFLIQTQCAVGFTLTRASRVIAVESSWVETDNEQAEDRTHRIGQTENVLVQRLCFKNSLDTRVLESNLKTRELTKLL